ncbi:hypothetical protein [Streptomyces sp. NPDC090083]|uniref:hypothetical protein n=1 Tax=Streptomyces sp. NPDC090083 TaxID=3365941 RepID=UPI0038095C42
MIHTVPAERDAGRYERPGFIITPGAVTAGPFIAVLAGSSASFDARSSGNFARSTARLASTCAQAAKASSSRAEQR